MWKNTWFLTKTTLRSTFRKRLNLLLYLGLPIGGVLLSTLLYSGGSGQPALQVGVVNADGTEMIAADTVRFLQDLSNVKVISLPASELKQQLADSKLDCGLVLDAGYSRSVLAGKPGHITIQSVKGAQATAYVKSMLNGYIDNVSALGQIAAGDSAKFKPLYDHYRGASFKLTAQTVNDTATTKNMSTQSIGFLIMFMMMSAVNLSELLLKNRENRTYYRIISSPISARTYVLSNVLVNLMIMLVQIAAALFFMRVVFGIDPGVPIGEMLGMLSLFALVSVSISLVIVSFAKSSAAAGAMQNFIVTPTCLIAGCFFPISIMPAALRRIADFLPQHWVLKSIEKLQTGASFSSVWFNLSILLAFAAVFFLIATYKLGRNNDTRNFV